MRLSKGVVTAAILFAANVVFFLEALKLPRPFEQGEPGPAFYPLILSVVLFISCTGVIFSEIREQTGFRFSLKDPKVVRPFSLICATALFIGTFEIAGYWGSTLVFTFLTAFIFEYGRKYSPAKTVGFCALIAFTITFTGWLFFDLLFDLHLPQGGF